MEDVQEFDSKTKPHLLGEIAAVTQNPLAKLRKPAANCAQITLAARSAMAHRRRAYPGTYYLTPERSGFLASICRNGFSAPAWWQSENKLQGQLDVEWLTRSDTRRAIVGADGVGALTKSAEKVAARRRKVQAVEDIEHFQAELSFQALGHRSVLGYRGGS